MTGDDEGTRPLPDGDDPFELLGVAPGADERELKRAYVRLIKRHRPERDPAGFQRIHAAYEAVRAGAWLAPLAPHVPETPASEPVSTCSAEESGPDSTDEPGPRPDPGRDLGRAIHTLLLAGRFSDAAGLLEETGPATVMADSAIERLRLRVACALLWFDGEGADRLYRPVAGGAIEAAANPHHGLFQELRDQRDELVAWAPPELLARVLATLPLFELEDTHELLAELERQLAAAPEALIEAFGRLGRYPSLLAALSSALGWEDQFASEWDDVSAVLARAGPLSTEREERLDRAIRRFDKVLEEDRTNNDLSLIFGTATFAQIIAFITLGWWSLGTLVLLLVGLVLAIIPLDRRIYRRTVQPWLMALIIEQGVAPAQVVARIQATERLSDNIGRFKDEIGGDAAAQLLFLLCRRARDACG